MKNEINWKAVKLNKKVEIDGVIYVGAVSKGRKMLLHEEFVKTLCMVKKVVKRCPIERPKNLYKLTMLTDYGKTIITEYTFCYPSEGYKKSNGEITSNKWDLYKDF